jgi:hypothetical protein
MTLRGDESSGVILSPSAHLGTGSAKDPYDEVFTMFDSKGFFAPLDAQKDFLI